MDRPDCIFAFGPPETGFYVLIKPIGMIVWIDINGLPEGHEKSLLDAIDSMAEIIIKKVEGKPRHFVKVDWAAFHYREHERPMAKIGKIVGHLLTIVQNDEAKMGHEFDIPDLLQSSPKESGSSDEAQYSS